MGDTCSTDASPPDTDASNVPTVPNLNELMQQLKLSDNRIQQIADSMRQALKTDDLDLVKKCLDEVVSLKLYKNMWEETLICSRRPKVNKQFGYCQLDYSSVKSLVDRLQKSGCKKILSLGSGLGFTEALVEAVSKEVGHPIKVVCTDPQTSHFSKEEYLHTFVNEVHVLDHEAALKKYSDVDALFMLWPGYCEPWSVAAVRTARQLGIKTVVYSGEWCGGCTGSDEMHEELEKYWEELEVISYPQWYGMHDRFVVYDLKADGDE